MRHTAMPAVNSRLLYLQDPHGHLRSDAIEQLNYCLRFGKRQADFSRPSLTNSTWYFLVGSLSENTNDKNLPSAQQNPRMQCMDQNAVMAQRPAIDYSTLVASRVGNAHRFAGLVHESGDAGVFLIFYSSVLFMTARS